MFAILYHIFLEMDATPVAAALGYYRAYAGPQLASIDYTSVAGQVDAGVATMDVAGLGLAAGGERWIGLRAVSAAGVEEENTDRVVCVRVDAEGALVGPAPNALLDARIAAAAGGKIDVTVAYSARGQAGVATGVQVCRIVAGAAQWDGLIATIAVRPSGITRQTVELDPTYGDGETVRLAARAVTAAGSTGPALRTNPVAADATAPADVTYMEVTQYA